MTFLREQLPDPVAYYEGRGLALKGTRMAPWKTTECRFHGGSDSMRIKVATGAFRCMACEARGGDVLGYHMAEHGLSFVDAAKELGAWIGDGTTPQRQPRPSQLTARDALGVLTEEATLIAVEGSRIGRGIKPTPDDLERIRLAAGRINHIKGVFA
jgi:hypothetical protein